MKHQYRVGPNEFNMYQRVFATFDEAEEFAKKSGTPSLVLKIWEVREVAEIETIAYTRQVVHHRNGG